MTWKTATLGEVTELITRGISPIYSEGDGIFILNQKCIRNHEVSLEPARKHDSVAKVVKEDRKLKYGDVLVNSTGTGTLGRVAQILSESDEELTVDSHVTIVRPYKELFYLPFFGYMLIAIEDQLKAAGEGASGQTELRRTAVANEFLVSYPTSKVIQQKIVAKLDAIFAEIDKATAAAEANAKNAEALFQSYLAEVFEGGGENWADQRLSDVALDIGRGKSKHRPRNDESLYGGIYPFIQTGDVRNAKKFITSYTQTYNEKGLIQSKLWNANTVCITIAANIAEIGILGFDACFPDSIIGIVVDKEKISKDFLYLMLLFAQQLIKSKSKGSAQENINMGTFEEMIFKVPPRNLQDKIVDELNNIQDLTDSILNSQLIKVKQLNILKQSILQQAFNGELVKD